MKIISQAEQLFVMEEMAASCWPVSYDQARELMFEAFNAEYGQGKWTFDPLSNAQQKTFEAWLAEDND